MYSKERCLRRANAKKANLSKPLVIFEAHRLLGASIFVIPLYIGRFRVIAEDNGYNSGKTGTTLFFDQKWWMRKTWEALEKINAWNENRTRTLTRSEGF
jgi:hypothetical protein